jgi:hypothetical protein
MQRLIKQESGVASKPQKILFRIALDNQEGEKIE